MSEYTTFNSKVSNPPETADDTPINCRAFNAESGTWEYMQLRRRVDYVGGRGHVTTYQRIGTDKGISQAGYDAGLRLGLIKIVSDQTARVLWLGAPDKVAA